MIPEGIIAALESTVSTEYAASTIAALNLSTSGRTPISGETESASHAVENHDSSVIGECSVHSSEGTITLNSDSQYQTAVESQNEGTAGGENLATTTTDLAPRLSNTLNAHHSAIPQGVFDLTEAALMAHHCSLNVNMSLDEIQGLTRPDELLQAAREMGFELPRECLEAESRNLCDWVEAQRHIRAHDRRT